MLKYVIDVKLKVQPLNVVIANYIIMATIALKFTWYLEEQMTINALNVEILRIINLTKIRQI